MNWEEVLQNLHLRFPRYGDWLTAWAPSYKSMLAGVPPDELKRAYRSVVDHWEYSAPPKPVEIGKAVKSNPGQAKPSISPDDWIPKVFDSPIGQRSLREGYGRGLEIWAKEHPGQWPGEDAIQELKDDAARFETRLASMLKEGADCTGLGIAQRMVGLENFLRAQFLKSDDNQERRKMDAYSGRGWGKSLQL